jgi:hypothetical protein
VRCGGSAYTRLGAIYIHPHIQGGLGKVRWERRRLEWNGMDMGCGWMARHAWLGMGRLFQPFRPARGLSFQAPLRFRTRILGRGPPGQDYVPGFGPPGLPLVWVGCAAVLGPFLRCLFWFAFGWSMHGIVVVIEQEQSMSRVYGPYFLVYYLLSSIFFSHCVVWVLF